MTLCLCCNGPVTPRTHGGPPKLYCSKACGKRARAARRRPRRKVLGDVTIIPSERSFASVYREALRSGIDLLETMDACYECRKCGRLPYDCEATGCAPIVLPVKAREAA